MLGEGQAATQLAKSASGVAHHAQFDLQAELLEDMEEVQHEAIAGDLAGVHLRRRGGGLTPSHRGQAGDSRASVSSWCSELRSAERSPRLPCGSRGSARCCGRP